MRRLAGLVKTCLFLNAGPRPQILIQTRASLVRSPSRSPAVALRDLDENEPQAYIVYRDLHCSTDHSVSFRLPVYQVCAHAVVSSMPGTLGSLKLSHNRN